jgi:hypothetical protein
VLLHAHSFTLGLAYGGIALLIAGIVAAISRRRVPDVAGIMFVAAAWLGVRGAWGVTLARSTSAWAFVALAAGGAASAIIIGHRPRARRHAVVLTALFVAPGAIALASVTPLAGSTVARIGLAVATIGIAVGLRDFDAAYGRKGAPWLLFGVAAIGVYLAVPDTELARVFLGVAIPFVFVSVPLPSAGFGPAGSAALSGLFTWVVFVGGRGRPGSVVGGLAAIGLLAAEPIGRRFVGRDRMLWKRLLGRYYRVNDANQDAWLASAFLAAVVQFGIALYASRIVGREELAFTATLVLAPVMALAIVATPELFPLERERRPDGVHSRSRSTSHRQRRSAARAHG